MKKILFLILVLALASTAESADKGPIIVASIFDITGIQRVEGTAMYNASKMAIEDINSQGGVLGRQLKYVFYDSQSEIAKYSEYANKIALQDKPAVVVAGISSASREAIRPVFDRHKILYLYPELYEGGVCDKNTFTTGETPDQQLAELVPWAIKQFGNKVYVVGADYNFGQISALWGKRYAEKAGATVVGQAFIPLESSEFAATIDEIQRLQPNVLISVLVGTNHTAFYRQFAAAGLNESIHTVSSTFGLCNEQEILTEKEAKNVTVAYHYYASLDNPKNKAFVARWKKLYGDATLTTSAMTTSNAWYLWAKAAEKAGTLDREAVIAALESGISIENPVGTVKMEGACHACTMSMGFAQVEDGAFKVIQVKPDVPPSFVLDKCDLIAKPETNKQFIPE